MAAYTTIDNPELYFQVKLYTGNGSDGNAITLDGDENMQPDFLWIKNRDATFAHALFDSVRGSSKMLVSSSSDPEQTNPGSGGLTSFDADGFTTDAGSGSNPYRNTNESGDGYVAWCWKAGTTFTNDASATSVGNTDSNGSASSTAGFSICKYVGAGASLDIQVKHGLSVKPAVMFTKNIEEAGGNHWAVYHHKNTSAPETDYLKLSDTTATTDDADIWNDTEPTSAIFTAGDHSGSNRSGDDFISYHWNEVQGYSKFGSFVSNNNADNSFIYTGFAPAMVIMKSTTSTNNWVIQDIKRPGYNPAAKLYPDLSNDEDDDNDIDFLSNGFKMRGGLGANTFVYMAFAQAPFVNSNGVPCNAR